MIKRYKGSDIPKFFRGDAAIAQPGIYEYLEAECYGYVVRLPETNLLRQQVRHLELRPVGRPSKRPVILYHSFMYASGTSRIAHSHTGQRGRA